MAKESMPFELKRPNAGTPVTNATEIDWGDKPLPAKVNEMSDEKSSTGNTNALSIENKINALIDCLENLIECVAFHTGAPFSTPNELKNSLSLLRYTLSDGSGGGGSATTSSTAICGQAICGQAICGNSN